MNPTDHIVHISPPLNPTDTVVDLFCGGGGSGSGILSACSKLGRRPHGTFVNHWDRAIEIHEANHPEHRHLKEDLFLLDPTSVFSSAVRPSLMWGSPSCQQFSISRGNRPISEQGRSHADTVVRWAEHLLPECLIVENVKQFLDYCRLKQRRCVKTGELQWAREIPGKKNGTTKVKTFPKLEPAHQRRKTEPEAEWELRMITLGYDRHLEPDLAYRGEYFDAWIEKVKALGYLADWKLIRSADHGDPTIRERLFVQFVRIDSGKRICWPDQRFIKPGAKRPVFKTNPDRELKPWPTARDHVIEWDVKGTSIFLKKKPLAPATMRRIAIGLVKFAFKDFFTAEAFALTSNKGFDAGLRDLDKPTGTLTCNSRGEGIVEAAPFILPKDQGHKGDYVTGVDHPCCAVQTTATDHLVEPFISHLRSVGNTSVAAPLRTLTAAGQHQLLVEAFLQVMDNAGKNGAGQRAFSIDEPVKTIPVKANQTLVDPSLRPLPAGVKFTLATLEDAIRAAAPDDVDVSRVVGLLQPLMVELKKAGKADVKPWVYVYYSNGAAGADIDTPVPTVRCKEGTAVCYPVLEFDGEFLLLDVLYRMLTVRELQRAQGFTDWRRVYTASLCLKPSLTPSKSALPTTAVKSSSPKSAVVDPPPLAAVHAQIDCGRRVLVIRNAERSNSSVSTAEKQSEYPLPEELVASVRRLAGMLPTQGRGTVDGAEVTRLGSFDMSGRKVTDFISQRRGRKFAEKFGNGTETSAGVVPSAARTTFGAGPCTISGAGGTSQTIDSILRTLCCYVSDVIGSCIPNKTSTASSCALTLELVDEFVWPEGITKTDIVKAIGNSVSSGVAEALTLAWYSQNEDISGFFETAAKAD